MDSLYVGDSLFSGVFFFYPCSDSGSTRHRLLPVTPRSPIPSSADGTKTGTPLTSSRLRKGLWGLRRVGLWFTLPSPSRTPAARSGSPSLLRLRAVLRRLPSPLAPPRPTRPGRTERSPIRPSQPRLHSLLSTTHTHVHTRSTRPTPYRGTLPPDSLGLRVQE